MPRFLSGDELGNIKSIQQGITSEENSEVVTLRHGDDEGRKQGVQKMAVRAFEARTLVSIVASAQADGSAHAYTLQKNDLSLIHEWKEHRLKAGQRYVGLSIGASGVFTCTSNGALRSTALDKPDGSFSSHASVLPMHICEWKLSPDESSFSYAGEEVEVSVWDTQSAFAPRAQIAPSEYKKRKRGNDLLPGEVWRAKNIANDSLSLRQPVHNTCLAYASASPNHIVAGTQAGDLRKYDIRTARRPVANWQHLAKVGGIKAVERGFHDHEIFIADQGCNLYSVDTRNGKIGYGYRGIAGAVTSIASSPSVLASTALDRYFRLHSTFPLAEPGQHQDNKGEVLHKLYLKSTPTVVVWDQTLETEENNEDDRKGGANDGDSDEDADEDVWKGMEEVDDEVDSREGKRARRSQKSG
ncbi:hypothetical protein OF83DRAFT_1059975 [Amylostereum chailletii]|nr:hypothetical protein OF83DRAFT_1059975 [Amylostereum chailletii]